MIGRSKERKELKDLYERNTAELVAIYGRRRVEKTFLVNETFQDKFAFKHTALSKDENEDLNDDIQLNNFYKSLIFYGLKNEEKPKNWFDAFFLLQKFLKEKIDQKDSWYFLMNFHG